MERTRTMQTHLSGNQLHKYLEILMKLACRVLPKEFHVTPQQRHINHLTQA